MSELRKLVVQRALESLQRLSPFQPTTFETCKQRESHMHCPVCHVCLGLETEPKKRKGTVCCHCGTFLWAEVGGRNATEMTMDDVVSLSDTDRNDLIRQRRLLQGQ